MSQPLWMHSERESTAQDSPVARFLAGEDAALDEQLLSYDLRASAAHVSALGAAGLLNDDDCDALLGALGEIQRDSDSGVFTIPAGTEDGHAAIEDELTRRLGEAGRRVHLGRSRNDQVLVATRLFVRDTLDEYISATRGAGLAAMALARRHEFTPMPGYTHLQRAVPSSVGLWMASFAESFADDLELLEMTRGWIDSCPLGTAAGYGVNLPLDRAHASDALGFSRMQINPMAAQASRGKLEHQALAAAWQSAQTLRRLGWDLVLFSSVEFGFVTCGEDATTGSSIMPNKRNPDAAELLRTCAATTNAAMNELQNLLSLPSGYHRDLQATKPPLLRGLLRTLEALRLVPGMLEGLTLHTQRMAAAITPAMHATDHAVELARAGLPFRDAYRMVATSLDEIGEHDPAESVRARVSPGGCADLRLDEIATRLRAE